MSRSKELSIWWALAAGLVSWQLFVPPIIGLADQGDFVRVLGPMGYAPKPRGPEHKYFYLTRKFDQDQAYREPRWEQTSSEFLPVYAAVVLNKLLFSPKEIDLTMMGFVHAVMFLFAIYRLLRAVRDLTYYRVAWALIILVLTDVGYVAYCNSWYTEPSSLIWMLLLVAESISLGNNGGAVSWRLARWCTCAILFVSSKTQNAPLSVPLAFFALVMIGTAKSIRGQYLTTLGAGAILAAGLVMYLSLLPAPKLVVTYNMIFNAILPESHTPAADLQALGLNPDYAQYSGTVAWSPKTGIADAKLVNSLQAAITPLSIITFYLQRPSRLWAHIALILPASFSLRPDFCGNFESVAGRPPGTISYAISFWSRFHHRYLPQLSLLVVTGLAATPLLCGLALFRRNKFSQSSKSSLALAACLSTCGVLAFLSSAFGDAWELVKHQFVFNLLVDVSLVWLILASLPAANRLATAALLKNKPPFAPPASEGID